jgi:hypothetical protein
MSFPLGEKQSRSIGNDEFIDSQNKSKGNRFSSNIEGKIKEHIKE